mmetsp:Transcript_15942/g.30435  ORF Transcript_15942/g.30435 Transcript_15942/m.30435 type:complete len:463 (+) Transcript_15942:127-1515(+)
MLHKYDEIAQKRLDPAKNFLLLLLDLLLHLHNILHKLFLHLLNVLYQFLLKLNGLRLNSYKSLFGNAHLRPYRIRRRRPRHHSLLLQLFLCLNRHLPCKFLSQHHLLSFLQRLTRIIRNFKILIKVKVDLLRRLPKPRFERLRKFGIPSIYHRPAVSDPGIVLPPVIDKGKRRNSLLVPILGIIHDVPIVLIMQILVIVIDHMSRILRILHELLQRIPREELPIRLLNPPIQLPEELSLLRLGKEVHLTRKGIEQLILSGGDVPPSVEQLGIELFDQFLLRRDRIAPVVGSLGHARHVGDGALVEFPHDVVFEYVPAVDLTARFVGFAVAGVDADDVGEAVGVEDAFGKGELAFFEEAEAYGRSVGGVGGGDGGRGGGGGGGEGEGGEGECQGQEGGGGDFAEVVVREEFLEGIVVVVVVEIELVVGGRRVSDDTFPCGGNDTRGRDCCWARRCRCKGRAEW